MFQIWLKLSDCFMLRVYLIAASSLNPQSGSNSDCRPVFHHQRVGNRPFNCSTQGGLLLHVDMITMKRSSHIYDSIQFRDGCFQKVESLNWARPPVRLRAPVGVMSEWMNGGDAVVWLQSFAVVSFAGAVQTVIHGFLSCVAVQRSSRETRLCGAFLQ